MTSTVPSTYGIVKRFIDSEEENSDSNDDSRGIDDSMTQDSDIFDSAEVAKRSAEADEYASESNATGFDGIYSSSTELSRNDTSTTAIDKRSVETKEEDSNSRSAEIEASDFNSTVLDDSGSDSTQFVKRSAISEEDDSGDSSSNSMEYYDEMVLLK